ncbi:MAG: helix-turn-helix transcriptional regulator [Rhizobacter sp.]|nr:helix-turn-helix transcriptional regulator [Ferruginibacter sp.]
MKSNHQQMVASIIKEARIVKGYTQKELAELSSISIRSVQRIENAQIQPRSYTLKLLSAVLSIPMEDMVQTPVAEEPIIVPGTSPKIILSVGLSIVAVLLYWAFIEQSAFPETAFEFLSGTAVFSACLTFLLYSMWRPKSDR